MLYKYIAKQEQQSRGIISAGRNKGLSSFKECLRPDSAEIIAGDKHKLAPQAADYSAKKILQF